MRKSELLKMKPQYATPAMMLQAANDIPVKKAYGYYKTYYQDVYKTAYYMRGRVDGEIIRIAIFLAENMRLGNKKPAFEVFIDKNKRDFVTYDYKYEKWSNAQIDRLSWPGYWWSVNKEYESRDFNKFVRKNLGTEKSGYYGVLEWQRGVRAEQLKARHKKETDPWDLEMSKVPPAPADWERWVDKCGITQNFIFYKYKKGGATKGYCSWCEKEVDIKNPKHNGIGKCSRCRHDIQYKSIGKAGTVCTDREIMYLLQKCGDGFVIRQYRAYKKYLSNEYQKPQLCFWEERRAIFDRELKGVSYYYGLYKNATYRWIFNGTLGGIYTYWYSSYAGSVYKRTLPSLKWFFERTGLSEMVHQLPKLDPEAYIMTLRKKPYLEQLAKAGLTRLAYDIMYGHYYDSFKFKKEKSLGKSLGIDKSRMQRLRKNNGGILFLKWLNFEKKHNKHIDDAVIDWMTKEMITPDEISFISDRMSERQVKNYLIRQQKDMRRPIKEIISTWEDYLKMAIRAKMNVHDEIVYRAKKLKQRHDELVEMLGSKALAMRAGEIEANFPDVDIVCEEIRSKYEFEDDTYAIVVPKNIEDILSEGQALHHCINRTDRYFERIHTRESFLLFLRKKEDIAKPWYTLEVEPGGTIRQKRTEYDRQNNDLKKAEGFLKSWQKFIQSNITEEDIRLAEESRNIRIKEFEDMRSNNIKISNGHLAGRLLADVLEEDLMESMYITEGRAI